MKNELRNRLWVRLSVVFSVMIFVTIVVLVIITTLIIRASTANLDALQESAEVAPIEASAPNEAEATNGLVPISVGGEIVAYVDVLRLLREPPRFPRFAWEEGLLIVAVVCGVIGVLFGVFMSRTLTKPLNVLAVTADAIGAGQWNRRVEAEGTTETRSLAESFNKMVDQLQRNEMLRRNLVADVAHELRTPITALQANIYAILDDAYPMTKDEIAGLYEQTRMLSRLVKDLHELSQAESGQLALDRQPSNFSETLGELIAPFRSVAESKGVQLEVDIPAHLPLVNVDEERFNQVMHNLLSNALRYTPQGGTITIRVRAEGETLRIEVRDTGEGIAPEHLPNVFERFYRADYARSRKTGGMGLGLAIAKAIVEAHDGVIRVSSSGIVGEGTTFTVQLPVMRGHGAG